MTTILSVTVVLAAAMTGASAAAPRPMDDRGFTASADGSTEHYVVIWPEGFRATDTRDLLIALHGHGSDRWQFAKDPRDECRAARDAAAKHGMIFVSPDYRAKTSWMGPKAEADTTQIIDEFRGKYRIRKVIVCGGSMGGTAALTYAVLHPDRVNGVVAMNPTANLVEYHGFQDAIRESFGGSKTDKPDEYRKRSAEFYPERLTMPVGMSLGGKDELVPPASAQRLAQRLQELKRDVHTIFRQEGGHSTTYDDATILFDFVLGKACSRQAK